MNKEKSKGQKADIYSLGVILFMMRTGNYPYFENQQVMDFDLFALLAHERDLFWRVHNKISRRNENLSSEFKDLFVSMTKMDPKERISIQNIKQHPWYNQEVYTQEESAALVGGLLEYLESKSKF